MKKLYFSKKLKLLKSENFSFVLKKHKKISEKGINIFSRLNILHHPRIGLTISKKYIKYSHDRNRIKRLIRENFRLNQYFLPNMDFIISTKSNVVHLNNFQFKQILEKLWQNYFFYL